MILVIQYMDMAKVIFDHVNKLRPYGYLLGNEEIRATPDYFYRNTPH